jgi:pyruvate dehydrogenase E2 component (dihydrolipoamide acetyltransferase)
MADLHLYLAATIDLDRAVTWLAETNARRTAPERLLMAALFLKAVARALREVPELNGGWVDGCSRPSDAIHLGVAVARRQGGSVVAALADTDQRSLDDVMRAFRELVHAVRTGRPFCGEPVQPTFTVTSLGELGVQAVFPTVVPPQLGGIGFGKIVEQPSAVAGAIVCSPAVTATLAADPRASDSHRGAHFLATVDRQLQRPEAL